MASLLSRLLAFRRAERGAAALELVLWTGLLVVPILNVMDVGLYVFQRIQLENAGQMAVHSGWALCDTVAEQKPVTTNCTGLTTRMTNAAQSTSLATRVTVGAPTVEYYCLDNSNVLVVVATAPTAPPTNCTSVSSATPSPAPGEYLSATVSYTYTPIFGAISVASAFTTPITYTARTRVQ